MGNGGINGMKKFITSGATADLVVVMATTGQTDKGKNEISAFILMKRPGHAACVRFTPTVCGRAIRLSCVLKTREANC
jgi:alkylation response protein AidB-like acyl-CoA dehydrogenase